MKSTNKHINKENIRRYLENRMTEAERNRFERELQKNPFEAEALEGFENIPTGELEKDLKTISARIQNHKRKTVYRYWPVAASFLLLIAAGWFWFQFNKNEVPPKVAELKQQPEQFEINEKQVLVEKDSGGKKNSAYREKPETNQQAVQPYENKPVISAPKQERLMAVSKQSAATENKTTIAGASQKSASDTNLNDEEELIAILNNDTSTGTIPEKVNIGRVVAGRAAFKADEDAVFPDSFKNVPVQEREAVQVAKGVAVQDQVEKQTPEHLQDLKAHPEGGMPEFEQYLKKEAVLPDAFRSRKATVKLLLFIDKEGTITDIQNRNGADSVLVEKAKKIIENGPAWNPQIVNGQKIPSEIKLKIVFSKP